MLKLRELLRVLLRVVPAWSALLLVPVTALASDKSGLDISLAPVERFTLPLNQPLKLANRATLPELTALEEFGIDNDTEQDVKAPPRLCYAAATFSWLEPSEPSTYRPPLRPCRCGAAPPTGPPYA
ncbi:MAG TPA: hypothetical protein VNL39_06155 [Xanthobacteraceae bacterium]|nr:hypothetical protein [Xanthobacteraceae bacterium]